MSARPDYKDVLRASERIKGFAHRTPALTSRTADSQSGAKLFFKAENLQRTGSFKFRGAFNAISALTPAQKKTGVVAFSSGNHAQGMALAAELLGVPATIIMPLDAPAAKITATRGYGAEVVTYDRYTQDRAAIGQELAEKRGLTLIPPYDHFDVIAGQGTAAKELIEDVGPLDMLLVCMGGGGLTAGTALSAAALSPGCKVYAVEPEAGNDGQRSFRSGAIVKIDVPQTIADGAQTQFLGNLTFPIIQDKVADVLTVSDAELVNAMQFFAARMKMVVEPTGCLAAAAVFNTRIDVRGQRVGIIISGGNIDLERFSHFLTKEA